MRRFEHAGTASNPIKLKLTTLTWMRLALAVLFLAVASADVYAQGPGSGRGPGFGHGPGFGRGQGQGRGRNSGQGIHNAQDGDQSKARDGVAGEASPHPDEAAGDDSFLDDRDTFHFLLDHHKEIRRTVENLPDGLHSVTESDNPEVVAKIQEHVAAMASRIEDGRPVRMWDPLFRALFSVKEPMTLEYKDTTKGVEVTQRSDNRTVVLLLQAHAKVVSAFVAKGMEEAHESHAVPTAALKSPKMASENELPLIYPQVQDFGGVVQLPDASQQPREMTRLLVDLTSGGNVDEVNAGLQKVARFVNIYAGAGRQSTQVKVVVVMHGEATLLGLADEHWTKRFEGDRNPNLELIGKLTDAGVEFMVCGQSLAHKHAQQNQLVPQVAVAVSALTANVNLQQDGFVRIPL
ncbi:MAG: DsrE family protein [Planctomycetaceae bacterium]